MPRPLDYSRPGGTRIDIMISRLASPNPPKRRGVLLLNPGGPGGSGLTLSTLLMSVVAHGLVEVYNPAQIDVLQRLNALLEGQ